MPIKRHGQAELSNENTRLTAPEGLESPSKYIIKYLTSNDK